VNHQAATPHSLRFSQNRRRSSKTGDTAAAPKIWEDPNGFKAAAEKLAADAQKLRLQVKDAETFKTAFGEVTKNCNACHQTYRINKS
jgi:cytochrome c556